MTDERLESIRRQLENHGQAHVLAYWDELSADRRQHLLDQIDQVNLDGLDELIRLHSSSGDGSEIPSNLTPAPYFAYAGPLGDRPLPDNAVQFRKAGEEQIRAGRVAAFTVAGGQGTRLGWRGPKGTYPATVVTGKPLFRVFAEQILATESKYDVTIPWYIMTSDANDAEIRAFFADNCSFGLVRKNIFMFPQAMIPSLDSGTHKLLLADKDTIAMNPDGHGGSLKALHASGALEDMQARGIEQISYFQIDNPLAKAIDPLFIGLHVESPDSSGRMSSKMVPKTDPDERVGVFCRSKEKTTVIEYSDLPTELAHGVGDNGQLQFIAGNIAIHLISVGFVEQLTSDGEHFALPYHRAMKQVPYIDPNTGTPVQPQEPNAIKFETFVFDALPLAESSLVYETSRTEEFAPIKNAQGTDSSATSHQLQSNRHGAWLEMHGVRVARNDEGHVDARIEISPLTALEPADLVRADLPTEVKRGEEIVL